MGQNSTLSCFIETQLTSQKILSGEKMLLIYSKEQSLLAFNSWNTIERNEIKMNDACNKN